MKVSELAKELGTTTESVLEALKSFKLKAKDGKQELSSAVISVIRSALKNAKPSPKPQAEKKEENAPAAKEKKAEKEEPKKEVHSKPKEPAQVKAAEKIIKKEVPKAKSVVRERTVTKGKSKLSQAPVITLKPLARKRKKIVPGAPDDTGFKKLKEGEQQAPFVSGFSATALEPSPTQGQSAAAKAALPEIEVDIPITVKDFSVKVGQKPSVVLKSLMKRGILAHINQSLAEEIVKDIALEFGFNISKVKTHEENLIEFHKQEDEQGSLSPRAPVVTLMGHVDHGKTTLLDSIRKTKVADSEHGGITQHIGAYSVQMPKGKITFLDTPGHEAFTAMRARGVHVTDIVILVVAADEGIMPQTMEAINHARAADVPIVVAITKIDRSHADIDKVKKQLSEEGLMPEDWGGKTVCVGVSAVTGQGMDTLLEMILLEAELLELKANYDKNASGIVVEAHLSRGKGVVATLIVQSGTLKEGEFVIVGPHYGKVKAMHDDHERLIKEAGPSMPVEILGLPEVPEAGEKFYVVEDEHKAREITAKRKEYLKDKKLNAYQKITLEDLYSQIQSGTVKELNVVLKGDVQGSVEALRDSLGKIPNDKVKLRFIHLGVGDVNTSDVLLAYVSKAIIIAFHVGIEPRAKEELEKEPVDVRQYRIIYDAVNDMKKALEGMLEAKLKKNFLSRVEIRQVFTLSRGIIAGCYVQKGKVNRKAHIDVVREGKVIFSGTLSSLKRFKDDVREVNEGMECGLTIEGFKDYQPGDMVEAYDLEKVAQTL